jgi:ketosteroid isomerase-like protein
MADDHARIRTAARHAVLEYLRVLTIGETEALDRLFSSDVVFEFPFAPAGVPKVVTGREDLKAHASRFPNTFDVRFVDYVFYDTVDPRTVIAGYRAQGTAVSTGKPYPQVCLSIVETDEDGLITHWADHWNPLVAIEALTPGETASEPAAVELGEPVS